MSPIGDHTGQGAHRANPKVPGGGVTYWVTLVAALGGTTLVLSAGLRLLSYIRPQSLSAESADKAIWVAASLAALVTLALSMSPNFRKQVGRLHDSTLLGGVALIVLAIGIAWTEYVSDLPTDIQGSWWRGFGPEVALATAVLIPVMVSLKRPPGRLAVRYLSLLGAVLALVWYLPVLINMPWSFDAHHSNPVLNDVLGPYVGKSPLADQIPQYTSILGYPVAPLLSAAGGVAGSKYSILLASAYLSVLAIVTAGLIVWIAYKALPSRFAGLAPLLVLPVMLVAGSGGTGSIGQAFSAFPARLLLPVLVLALLIKSWHTTTWWTAFLLGILSGAAVLNNPEFGSVAFVALLAVVAVAAKQGRLRATSIIFLGATTTITGYILFLYVTSPGFNPDHFAAYARAFGQGSLSLSMPSVGTFLLILALPSAAMAYAGYWLRVQPNRRNVIPGLVAIFSGVMTLGSFAYYVGRSSSTGQLQALLPFFALGLVATIGMVGLPTVRPQMTNSRLLGVVLVAAMPAFAIACVVQAPDPRIQWGKVVPNSGSNFFDAGQEALPALRAALSEAYRTFPDAPVSTALDNGNLLAAVTGIPSRTPTSYIGDAELSLTIQGAICSAITQARGAVLVPSQWANTLRSQCALEVRQLSSTPDFSAALTGPMHLPSEGN